MTNRIDEIRARVAKATEGPWDWHHRGGIMGQLNEAGILIKSVIWPSHEYDRDMDIGGEESDLSFIAHSRADIPWLLAEVDRLTAERDAALAGSRNNADWFEQANADRLTLTAERDHWAKTARQAGVCMSCQGPNGAPEPYGCTDCLNTGWSGEYHNEVAALKSERDWLRAENERMRSGLNTLATTYYKDDQHQEYAAHVLTFSKPMENDMNETPAMHDQITPEAMQTVIAQLEYLASDHRYVAKWATERHGDGANDDSGFMVLPHNPTIGTYKRRAELLEGAAAMLRQIAAERETPETSK